LLNPLLVKGLLTKEKSASDSRAFRLILTKSGRDTHRQVQICLEVCPHNVFRPNGKSVIVNDRNACMECGACSRNRPAGARSVQSGVGCAAAVIKSLLGRNGGGPQTDQKGRATGGCCS